MFTAQMLKNAINRAEARRILETATGIGWGDADWTHGGCLILAQALLQVLPDSALIEVLEDDRPTYYSVRHDGYIWDGYGSVPERRYDGIYRRRAGIPGRVWHRPIAIKTAYKRYETTGIQPAWDNTLADYLAGAFRLCFARHEWVCCADK